MDTAKTSTQAWECVLSSVAAILCIVACVWAGQAYDPISPLTAAYLIEVASISIACGAFIWFSGDGDSSFLMLAAWTTGGMLVGITIMGMLSIGALLIPSDVMLISAATMAAGRKKMRMFLNLGVCSLAAIAQAGLMLLAIRLAVGGQY